MTSNPFSALCATAVLLFAVAVTTGCGSSGESADALTKKQFVKKAGEICVQVETEELEKSVAYKRQHPSASEEELYEPALFPPLEKEQREIEDLVPPEELQPAVEEMTAQLEADVAAAKKASGRLDQTDFEKSNQLAKKAGLEMCSNTP